MLTDTDRRHDGHPTDADRTVTDAGAEAFVAHIAQLERQLVELAGRVGWLQSENARLSETIRQLQAPAVSHMCETSPIGSGPKRS